MDWAPKRSDSCCGRRRNSLFRTLTGQDDVEEEQTGFFRRRQRFDALNYQSVFPGCLKGDVSAVIGENEHD